MGTARGWVFYDGTCGICGRWVPRWAPWLAARGLAVAPLQEPWVVERTGLSRTELLDDITLLLHDGSTRRGADAYRYLMRSSAWTRPIAWLVARGSVDGLIGCGAAYLPLVWLGIHWKAGHSPMPSVSP